MSQRNSRGRRADAPGPAARLPRTALPEPGGRPWAMCPASSNDVTAGLWHRAPASTGRTASNPPGALRVRLRQGAHACRRLGGSAQGGRCPVGWLDRGVSDLQRVGKGGRGGSKICHRVAPLADPRAPSLTEPGFANLVTGARAMTKGGQSRPRRDPQCGPRPVRGRKPPGRRHGPASAVRGGRSRSPDEAARLPPTR